MLAGYLSGFKWYKNLHPEELLELAEFIINGVDISFKEKNNE